MECKVAASPLICLYLDTDSNPVSAEKKYKDDVLYRKFRRQLLHTSLAKMLATLKPGMTMPEVAMCPDGHYRKVVYDLGP